ncbi:MAG: polyprenyl synthetase family protein [Chloroflexi bacterium]|nr:polyprenyl synthetase family protein [Chloroflexota bacterium]
MKAAFGPYLSAIEEELRSILAIPEGPAAPLQQMMAYHLGWLDQGFEPVQTDSGKRLRPLLCLLTCEAAGDNWQHALPAAAALELVHNFSLIHDDIEDNSPTRRGRATVWSVWGLPHGINVGDSMLVLAHLALQRLSAGQTNTATVLAALRLLDETCHKLCQGQYLDMAFEGHLDVSEEAYLEMIGGKTAALIAASAEMGALIAEAGEATVHYREYGWQLGLAFQMVDDLLGIWGDPSTTGKPAASDISSRKMTLPIIFALRTSRDSRHLAELYRAEHLSESEVAEVVAILDRCGAREYVQEQVADYEAKARAALDAAAPSGPVARLLGDLAASLTLREK